MITWKEGWPSAICIFSQDKTTSHRMFYSRKVDNMGIEIESES